MFIVRCIHCTVHNSLKVRQTRFSNFKLRLEYTYDILEVAYSMHRYGIHDGEFCTKADRDAHRASNCPCQQQVKVFMRIDFRFRCTLYHDTRQKLVHKSHAILALTTSTPLQLQTSPCRHNPVRTSATMTINFPMQCLSKC